MATEVIQAIAVLITAIVTFYQEYRHRKEVTPAIEKIKKNKKA